MNFRILGSTLPVLELQLQPNESVVAVSGELSWMSRSIVMRTTTQTAGSGGLFGVLKRVASGGSIFMTEYTAQNEVGMVPSQLRYRGTFCLSRSPAERNT